MRLLKQILLLVLSINASVIFTQTVCDPAGNVMVYSNYEGGTLNIDVDADIPNLKIGISTYEIVTVNISGTFAGNVTGVIFAGFNAPASITGVDPAIVTVYSTTTDNIAITNYLGDEIIPGFPPLVNCMTGAEGCGETATGGGNSSPQIVQFFLAEFGPGSTFYAHWTDYSLFPGSDFLISEGGNCCFEDPVTDPNPIYVGGAEYNFLPDTTLLCGADITLDISFYQVVWGDPEWSTGDVGYTVTLDEPGVYSFTVADYCHYDPGSYLLTDTIVIEPCATTIDTAICDGDSYTLPDGTIVTDSGAYEITLTGVGGDDSLVIVNLSLLPVYTININDAICDGITYILPDGTSTTTAGIYTFNLLSGSGCDSTVIINLTISSSYNETINAAICAGDNYTLPDGLIVNATGTYISNFTTVAGCDSIITTSLLVNPEYLFNIDTTVCVGEDVLLPDGTTTNIPGTYLLTFSTISGCDSTFSFTLNNYPVTNIVFDIPPVVCAEASPVNLIASPAGGVFSGDGVVGSTFDPALTGAGGPFTIAYSVNDANGCITTATYEITVDQNFADAGNDTTIFDTGVAELNANTGGNYNWSPSAGLTCIDCPTTYCSSDTSITYTLFSVNPNGCIASDDVTVTVLISNENIFVPNSFTPNGDGTNDIFSILGPGIILIKSFSIYDRWGELIFNGNEVGPGDTGSGWDGTFKSEPVNQGVYAYTAQVQLVTGRLVFLKGNVTLIR